MLSFKEYIPLVEQKIKSTDVPTHIKTKEFRDMLSRSKANKDLVLLLHVTDQGHEAELLNMKSPFEKELLQHRIKGGAKIVEDIDFQKK